MQLWVLRGPGPPLLLRSLPPRGRHLRQCCLSPGGPAPRSRGGHATPDTHDGIYGASTAQRQSTCE
eukprot:10627141-Alexandrium_andersonii.AAC.1